MTIMRAFYVRTGFASASRQVLILTAMGGTPHFPRFLVIMKGLSVIVGYFCSKGSAFTPMHPRITFIQKWLILCSCYLVAACNNNSQPATDNTTVITAINAFQQQLEQIGKQGNDAAGSGKCILCGSATPDIYEQAYRSEMESEYEIRKKNLATEIQPKEAAIKKTPDVALLLSVILIALATCTTLLLWLKLLRIRKEARLQQQFTSDLLRKTEEERGRTAVDIHDGIGHELLTLKNNLQEDKQATESRIDAIINDIRIMGRDLHPIALDKIGLSSCIEYLCEQMMNGGQLFISTEIDYKKELRPGDELQVYRIIHESLTNVIKYAAAIAARISIASQDNKLLVTIMDNGKGFDVQGKLSARSSFGLHSLVERGKALGGTTTIVSSALGTIINVEIPIGNA